MSFERWFVYFDRPTLRWSYTALCAAYGWQAVYEDIAAGVLVEVKQDSYKGV